MKCVMSARSSQISAPLRRRGSAEDLVLALKKEQFNLRFQQATGQLEKTSRMREVRRMIARAKTVLREKSPKAKV